MGIKFRIESLDGALLHEGRDGKMVKADRGAQLFVRLKDDVVMGLISPRRDCVVIGQGNRRFMAGFNRITEDGTCVLDLHSADQSGPPSR